MLRLLFDQNISFRILKLIEDHFPESAQVRILGLEDKSDIEIWNYARENDYSIVTFLMLTLVILPTSKDIPLKLSGSELEIHLQSQ